MTLHTHGQPYEQPAQGRDPIPGTRPDDLRFSNLSLVLPSLPAEQHSVDNDFQLLHPAPTQFTVIELDRDSPTRAKLEPAAKLFSAVSAMVEQARSSLERGVYQEAEQLIGRSSAKLFQARTLNTRNCDISIAHDDKRRFFLEERWALPQAKSRATVDELMSSSECALALARSCNEASTTCQKWGRENSLMRAQLLAMHSHALCAAGLDDRAEEKIKEAWELCSTNHIQHNVDCIACAAIDLYIALNDPVKARTFLKLPPKSGGQDQERLTGHLSSLRGLRELESQHGHVEPLIHVQGKIVELCHQLYRANPAKEFSSFAQELTSLAYMLAKIGDSERASHFLSQAFKLHDREHLLSEPVKAQLRGTRADISALVARVEGSTPHAASSISSRRRELQFLVKLYPPDHPEVLDKRMKLIDAMLCTARVLTRSNSLMQNLLARAEYNLNQSSKGLHSDLLTSNQRKIYRAWGQKLRGEIHGMRGNQPDAVRCFENALFDIKPVKYIAPTVYAAIAREYAEFLMLARLSGLDKQESNHSSAFNILDRAAWLLCDRKLAASPEGKKILTARKQVVRELLRFSNLRPTAARVINLDHHAIEAERARRSSEDQIAARIRRLSPPPLAGTKKPHLRQDDRRDLFRS